MTVDDTTAFRNVLGKAGALTVALRKRAGDNPVAGRLAELVERDTARLAAALKSGDEDAVAAGLMFPSLDGRAADALGGFDMEGDRAVSGPYMALNQALAAAVEKLDG